MVKRPIKIKHIGVFVVLLVFVAIISYFYLQNSLNIHFVDEDENIVGGFFLLKDKMLYSDIFVQHQPLAYWVSSQIQNIIKPHSIFTLIRSHRIFMIAWSAFWILLLYYRYGVSLALTSIIYEILKVFLLGNVFLAESLVVYPTVYLVSLLFYKRGKISSAESFFIGFVSSIIFFLLSPLWFLLIYIVGLLIVGKKITKQNITFFFMGWIPPTILALKISDLISYVYSTIYINVFQYIPSDTSGFEPNVFKSFFAPVITLVDGKYGYLDILYKVFVLVVLAGLYELVRKKKYWVAINIFILLGLSNIRYVPAGEVLYRGFHMLVWFSLLIFFFVYFLTHFFERAKSLWSQVADVSITAAVIILSVVATKNLLFVKRDVQKDYYINYSPLYDLGEATRIMKREGDALFQAPDKMLIYWQADIGNASNFIFFYPWMKDDKLLSNQMEEMFENDPPEFFYYDKKYISLEEHRPGYVALLRDGVETGMFVKPEVVENLSEKQQGNLEYLRFYWE
jgi:hypothetical protein